MNTRRLRTRLTLTALSALLTWTVGYADDTDIYLTPPDVTGSEPLVMFSLDYKSNLGSTWSCGACTQEIALYEEGYLAVNPATTTLTSFDIYRAALKKAFASLSGVKVGLMLPQGNKFPGGTSLPECNHSNKKCTNGGYIARGFESLLADDSNGAKAEFHAKLAAMPLPQGNLSHDYQAAEMFFEYYRYLMGGAVLNGHNGYTSYDGNSGDGTKNIDVERPGASWDTTIENGNNYLSPLSGAECSKLFTVNFTFGAPTNDGDSDAYIKANRSAGGMGLTNLPSGAKTRFEAILSWLNQIDLADGQHGTPDLSGTQKVISYFLTDSANPDRDSLASKGGTGAAIVLSGDVDELVEQIREIFTEILSISTTFVAASIPVNVFNRSEMLDNVYVSLFQPLTTARWPGNIKKLKLSTNLNGDLIVVDANNQEAIAVDGRISYSALTYWTNAASLPYPDPNITGQEAEDVVAGKDGRFVPRGGAGQKINGINGSGGTDPGLTNTGSTVRKLYTEPTNPLNGAALMDLNADNTTVTALISSLGLASTETTKALCLLKYVRGYDVTNLTSCASPGVRPWLFGDSLHSQPQPVNYGAYNGHTEDNPDIRIVVGGNDGFLRMIRNTDSTGADSGKEVWAFMPKAVMPIVEKLALNSESATHPYGVDGPTELYMRDVNQNGTIEAADGDKVWIFFGLRRGGKAYYGLDITNPDLPKYLWTIDKTKAGFSELGMTFSKPRLISLNLDGGLDIKPAVVFAGGYDTNKDTRPGPGTNDSEGNAIYIVDAETGALLWKAVKGASNACSTIDSVPACTRTDLNDSIPSEINMLDANGDDIHDRGYVGDTGGVVWRIDVKGSNRSTWKITPVLSVGRHAAGATATDDRRFFHRPDIAISSDGEGDAARFDAIMIGSGDRANPLDKTLNNRFYMLKDRNVVSGTPPSTTLTESDLADLTDNCLQNDTCSSTPSLTNGWFIQLENAEGEKALSTPVTLNGVIYFTTYEPPPPVVASCSPPEGSGSFYAIKLQNATAAYNFNVNNDESGEVLDQDDRSTSIASGGIPSDPVVVSYSGSEGTSSEFQVMDQGFKFHDIDAKRFWKTFWYQENTD